MKLNLKYIITVSVLVGMTGCDDKIEPFEITGSTATPVAISASTVQSEALPGRDKIDMDCSSGRLCLYANQI